MSNSREIYNDLLEQYNRLDDEDKRAIIIYKSKLFRLINLITSIPEFEQLSVEEIIERLPDIDKLKQEVWQFNQILNRPENMIVKYSVFKNVNLDDFNSLVEYLRLIYYRLNSIKEKIILKDDLTVYRGIAFNEDEELDRLAQGNLISTSIKIEDTEPYMSFKRKAALYMIRIKAGTPLLVAPTSLVCTYRDKEDYLYKKLNGLPATSLKLVNRGEAGVEEIILFKDMLEIVHEMVENREIDGKMISIHQIDSVIKRKNSNERKK